MLRLFLASLRLTCPNSDSMFPVYWRKGQLFYDQAEINFRHFVYRPSVIVSDLVAIRETGSGFGGLHYNRGTAYGGVVIKVELSKLTLRLPDDFPRISGPNWDVRFTVNRLLFRRMHHSVRMAQPHGRILFPSPEHQSRPPARPQVSLDLDRRISSNPQQSLAVRRIASKPPGGIPFIIFGPYVS